jgi:hypothetical protein
MALGVVRKVTKDKEDQGWQLVTAAMERARLSKEGPRQEA